MGFQKHFQQEIRQRYGAEAAAMCTGIEAHYQAIYPEVAFARRSANPIDRRLDFCAYLLATIQVLEGRGAGFEEIREVCLGVTLSYVKPANGWQRWVRRLPVKLAGTPIMRVVARVMAAKAGKKGHPDGFLARVVTDRGETFGLGYGFDILECGITTLFRRHHAGQYVPILCEVDRVTSGLAGLEMVRTGTLATGASRCDFRFRILK